MGETISEQVLLGAVLAAKSFAERFAARCNIRDSEFSDEVMQEACSRVLRGKALGFVREDGSIRQYAKGIVYHVCISVLLAYYRSAELPVDMIDPVGLVDEIDRRESIARVRRALALLPPEERELILQSARFGGTRGIRQGQGSTVYVRRHRAMQRFIVAYQRAASPEVYLAGEEESV
ncbi:MAG: hypothetical protein M3O30_18345 [Planctomycetota bacterium]|nr:hypothetical protein [Planctomycetota bacterium]